VIYTNGKLTFTHLTVIAHLHSHSVAVFLRQSVKAQFEGVAAAVSVNYGCDVY